MPFDTPLDSEESFVLGAICGDGTIHEERHRYKNDWYHRKVVALKVKDKTFAQEFKQALEHIFPQYTFGFSEVKKGKNKGQFRVRSRCKFVVDKILKHIPLKKKTFRWRVPDDVDAASFLRGFFLSEGHVEPYKNPKWKGVKSVTMATVNKEGMEEISNLLDGLHIAHSLYQSAVTKNGYPVWKIYIKSESRDKFFRSVAPPKTRATMKLSNKFDVYPTEVGGKRGLPSPKRNPSSEPN